MGHRHLLVLCMLALLAACGAPSAAPASSPVPTTAPAPASSSVPTTAPAAVAQPAPTSGPILAHKTTEGYQALGDPNAPVTLTMYSDFL